MTNELERVRDIYLGIDPDAKPLSLFEMLYTFVLPFGSFAIGIAIPLWPIVLDLRLRFDAWWAETYSVNTDSINSFPSNATDMISGLLPMMAAIFLLTSLAGIVSKNARR